MKKEKGFRYDKEFDEVFAYEGRDLGAHCTKEGTVFKVWSPLADKVELRLYDSADAAERRTYEMEPQEKGVFSWETEEYLHGTYYDFMVYRGREKVRTADPYAYACGANGVRSMAVDLGQTDPEGFEKDRAPAPEPETIIYELHVKDFSYDEDSGVPAEYRGKYKAFTVSGTNGEYPTCMEHLKELGITHVHLLPVYDFGSVDECGSDDQFNWGYDPVNYNVPEGSYATDPYDGAVRIREFKEMVQALHENGIRVVMDVVYNHTYKPDSWMERMAPGYYVRRLADGTLANGSGCKSDFAAGRAMVDNYIVDSVLYWAREYHIDGFRFDLMGLLTVELMNRIRRELDEIYGKGEKLLYGEPWRAAESPMEQGTRPALKENVRYLDEGIAVFCDYTRDAIKGDVFYEKEPGFVNGGTGCEEDVLKAVSGWCAPEDATEKFTPKCCSQIVNYTSAHDNYTLWDKLVITMHGAVGRNNEYVQTEEQTDDTVFLERYEDVVAANKLAALVYFTCQGHLFFQAGEEYGRTKRGDSNSFSSSPEVNMLRWHQTVEYEDLLSYYKGLISLRKKLPGLCDKSADAAKRIFAKKIWGEGVVSFEVDNRVKTDGERENAGNQNWERLMIVYNASDAPQQLPLPKDGLQADDSRSTPADGAAEECRSTPADGAAEECRRTPAGGAAEECRWEVLADGGETDCRKPLLCTETGMFAVAAHSGMILGRKAMQ